MESERELSQMVKDAFKSSYGQLKVTQVSTAKKNLEEQKLIMRRALDQKEQETTSLRTELNEEKERSTRLQEEVKQLQEEMQLLRSSAKTKYERVAEQARVKAEKNMEDSRKEIHTLQTELREEWRQSKELEEDIGELKTSSDDVCKGNEG